jgi:hypothetical protein
MRVTTQMMPQTRPIAIIEFTAKPDRWSAKTYATGQGM